MGLASLQVCMDSSDWFQGALASANHEVNNELMIDTSSSSPISGPDNIMLTSYPGPPSSRLMRPPHDHALNCPRCDSAHTKFCYYNNYSLTQPRYFCKTCRRYWTKGGTLRNIPVGGGCRKNKKTTNPLSKKPLSSTTDVHRFSAHQNQVGSSLLGGQGSGLGGHEQQQHSTMLLPIDFMECSRNNSLGMIGDPNFNGLFSPFGYSSYEGVENYHQKVMNPYEGLNNEDDYVNGIMDDVKPSTTKLMGFDNWQNNNVDKDYSVGLGSWTSSIMNNRF